MARVVKNSGNHPSRSESRNCETSSPPYGYGGRTADRTVLPVRIVMSPPSSTRCRGDCTTPSTSGRQSNRGCSAVAIFHYQRNVCGGQDGSEPPTPIASILFSVLVIRFADGDGPRYRASSAVSMTHSSSIPLTVEADLEHVLHGESPRGRGPCLQLVA